MLVLGLGLLSKSYKAHWGQPLFGVCGPLRDFGKVHSMNLGRLLMWKSHWKRLGWVCELCGANHVSLVWRAQIWRVSEPAGWVRGTFNKGTMEPASTCIVERAVLTLCPFSPFSEVSLIHMYLALYELLPLCWSPDQVSLCVSKPVHAHPPPKRRS